MGLLIDHNRGYSLSCCDLLTSLATGFSGAPYGIRHCQLSNRVKSLTACLGHRLISALEFIPVAGALFSLIESIIAFVYKKCFTTDPPIIEFLKNRFIQPLSSSDHSLLKNAAKAIQEHRKKESDIYVTLSEGMISTLRSEKVPQLKISHTFAEDMGPRPTMEDAHVFYEFDLGVVTGIFDGHGGSEVSKYAAEAFKTRFPAMLKKTGGNIRQAFTNLINNIVTEVFEQEKWDNQGSTAVISYIDKKTNLIYTATLGDSEIAICRKIKKKRKLIPLSCVRDWTSPKDFQRLVNVHGSIKMSANPKTLRSSIDWGVNVSRAVGDKLESEKNGKPLIIHKPKITVNRLKKGDRLVIACDGLWDYVKGKEIVQLIENHKSAEESLAEKLVHYAVHDKGSGDNVTVLTLDIA